MPVAVKHNRVKTQGVTVTETQSAEAASETTYASQTTAQPTTTEPVTVEQSTAARTTTTKPRTTATAPQTTAAATMARTAASQTTALQTTAVSETTTYRTLWGTSEDFDAYAVERELNEYAASLPRCALDPSLGKDNSCWMGCERSFSYKSEEALKSSLKWIIDISRNESLKGQPDSTKVYFNIKVFTNEQYGATYYDYYVFYMLGG